MSAVLEPQAPAAVPANDDTVEVIDRAEINDGKALVAYSRTEAGLLALKEDLAGKVYDLATVKGNELARQDRQRCVSLRTSLEKKRLEFKRPVLDIGKMIDAEAKRITDEILKLEGPIDAAIKADEARREEIRQQKAAAEAARQQAHRDGIAKIRSYADAARLPGMTAERLLKGLSALEAMVIDPAAWEEFATEAAHVLAETTAAVKAEHAALVEREAEAARLAQQAKEQAERQAELDRVAAEQAAQAAAIAAQQAAAATALAAQQAEIERQRAELEAQQRAAAEAEAQRKQDEQDREDAHRRALWLEAQAALPAAPIPMQSAPVLSEKTVADANARAFVDRIERIERAEPMDQPLAMPTSIPVGEVLESSEPVAAPGLIDDGKRWKLGELGALFGVGLTAEFVRSLGIEPVATDKRALLFTTLQVIELRSALVAHLMSLEIECSA